MPIRKWIESTNNAIEGILYAAKTERHLRYHLYSAAFILTASYIIGVRRYDFLIISIAVILVLLAEMINTAVEYVVDMLSPGHSEKARIAKDIAAGAVLITAFGAVVIGYIILFPYISEIFRNGFQNVRHQKDETALLAFILVLIIVIMLKAYSGKGHPLRGGMPSGHSAVAFSIWVTVTYISKNLTVSIICFILSTLIAQSRIIIKAHTPLEVIAGAFLGAGITFLLFFFFY